MIRLSSFVLTAALASGCLIPAPLAVGRGDDGGTPPDATPVVDPPPAPTDKLDLLFVVDDSNSMRENQANIMAQFEPFIRALIDPPCVSDSNPLPHACNPADPTDHPQSPPARDLHVGIVSTDLGTPGAQVPGCQNSDAGDDGRINPIRYGLAMRQHEPFDTAPAGFRPADCTDPDEFPAFLSYTSGETDVNGFVRAFRCSAGLYVGGCGLEQQLESAYRALVWNPRHPRAGETDPTAGFIREDAVLAIVMLTDEEDMSVRDCRYADGTPCADARDVFESVSTSWASPSLNLRGYLYTPGGAQDPTWPLERYVDPRNPRAGFLSLKPGHPERVVFAAITGVPLAMPVRPDGHTDWNSLLGAPDLTNPDNFNARNSATSYTEMTPEGPVSMRQANADPNCSERVVPACRRPGTMYSPAACNSTDQYFAWPARRIVEVARRFDESRLCRGTACHNGIVASICDSDYTNIMQFVAETCLRRMAATPD